MVPLRQRPTGKPSCGAACFCCLRCLPPGTLRWLFLHHADHRRNHNGDAHTAPGLGGDRHPVCNPLRLARRAHRPHDQHRQRFWQRTGFAGRCDHLRRGAQPAGPTSGVSISCPIPSMRNCTASAAGRSLYLFPVLLGGASRLARFNISHDPQPRNPGRPDRKYFVGMPIPAAAGLLAASVHLSTESQCLLVGRHSLAHPGRAHGLLDGQHLAILVGQGDQLSPAAIPSGCCCRWRSLPTS
jgi:hypothetical protein